VLCGTQQVPPSIASLLLVVLVLVLVLVLGFSRRIAGLLRHCSPRALASIVRAPAAAWQCTHVPP
jgi:hypothetical protein